MRSGHAALSADSKLDFFQDGTEPGDGLPLEPVHHEGAGMMEGAAQCPGATDALAIRAERARVEDREFATGHVADIGFGERDFIT